jgi:hypothetical protein
VEVGRGRRVSQRSSGPMEGAATRAQTSTSRGRDGGVGGVSGGAGWTALYWRAAAMSRRAPAVRVPYASKEDR